MASRYNPEQRRRHHDAHERVAQAHESAARTHDRVAKHFEGRGDTARAERERDAAAKERLKARIEHDTAREFGD
jgi:hypothetical protein